MSVNTEDRVIRKIHKPVVLLLTHLASLKFIVLSFYDRLYKAIHCYNKNGYFIKEMIDMQPHLLLNAHRFDNPLSSNLQTLLTSISTIKQIEKGAYIFHEGMDAHNVYMIKSGLVQISKLTSGGQELILRICRKEDVIGELTLFNDYPKYLLNAKVLESGEVFVIDKSQLEKMLIAQNNTELTLEIMKWISNHMRKFQLKIRDLLLNGKKGALYSTLIRLANSFGIERNDGILINLTLTNQELANFCNTTREYVNRMLSDLRKRHVISMSQSGKILIKDIEYLRTENGCEGCPIEICNIN